jgi:pantothenate kinase
VFDRDLEISRAGARLIAKTHRIILVEGNYLLLDQTPWSALSCKFDLAVALDVPRDVLAARLTARWLEQGLSPENARKRARQNDLVNADLVRSHGLSGENLITITTARYQQDPS